MRIGTQKPRVEGELKQAWQALQGTPSYVERFRDEPNSFEAEAHQFSQTFCGTCGFWVEGQHQCPQEQEVIA